MTTKSENDCIWGQEKGLPSFSRRSFNEGDPLVTETSVKVTTTNCQPFEPKLDLTLVYRNKMKVDLSDEMK